MMCLFPTTAPPATGGACRCKVVEGAVLQTGRDAKEINLHPARIIKATVLKIEPMTHDIGYLRLKPAEPLYFSAGQYTNVQFSPDLVWLYLMAMLQCLISAAVAGRRVLVLEIPHCVVIARSRNRCTLGCN